MKKFMKRWHHKNAPGCQHDDKDDSPDDTTTEEEYLKSVGDSVANMLDPFGKCRVHVHCLVCLKMIHLNSSEKLRRMSF